ALEGGEGRALGFGAVVGVLATGGVDGEDLHFVASAQLGVVLLLKPRDADDVTRGDLAVGILNDLRRGLARPPEQLPGEGAGGGEERLAADDQGTGEILEAVLDPRVGVLGANTDR